jgi:hypothetical protein
MGIACSRMTSVYRMSSRFQMLICFVCLTRCCFCRVLLQESLTTGSLTESQVRNRTKRIRILHASFQQSFSYARFSFFSDKVPVAEHSSDFFRGSAIAASRSFTTAPLSAVTSSSLAAVNHSRHHAWPRANYKCMSHCGTTGCAHVQLACPAAVCSRKQVQLYN